MFMTLRTLPVMLESSIFEALIIVSKMLRLAQRCNLPNMSYDDPEKLDAGLCVNSCCLQQQQQQQQLEIGDDDLGSSAEK